MNWFYLWTYKKFKTEYIYIGFCCRPDWPRTCRLTCFCFPNLGSKGVHPNTKHCFVSNEKETQKSPNNFLLFNANLTALSVCLCMSVWDCDCMYRWLQRSEASDPQVWCSQCLGATGNKVLALGQSTSVLNNKALLRPMYPENVYVMPHVACAHRG